MQNSVLIGAALATGALVPFQLAFNAQLGAVTKSPFTAGLIVFIVGAAVLATVVAVLRQPLPEFGELMRAPKTVWLGGLIATLYILAIVVVTPRLGIGTTALLVIAGQILTALVLDHFGAFGNPHIAINPQRVIGAALVIGGVFLIRFP